MNRKIIVLNLALIALAAALGWLLRVRWLEAQAHNRAVLSQAGRAQPLLPPPSAPAPKPATPVEYLDIAQRMLFSKDRNPTVVIAPPPPPPSPPPMPALPRYHGQMAIGNPVVLLSIDSSGTQKSYHAGDKVGPFELVSFDRDKIMLNWNGQAVERKLDELAPKETVVLQQAQPPPASPSSSLAPAAAVSLAAAKTLSADKDKDPAFGGAMGEGYYACAPGDTLPAGTVKNGYKKITGVTPFGASCRWEKVQ